MPKQAVWLWRAHHALPMRNKVWLRSKVARHALKPGDTVVMLACGRRARQTEGGVDAVCLVTRSEQQGRRVRARVLRRPRTGRDYFESFKHYQAPHMLRPDEHALVAAHPALRGASAAL